MTQEYKIGSQWTTRGGWPAVVVEASMNGYEMLVYHSNDGTTKLHVTHTGNMTGSSGNCEYDLISPYDPPPEPRSGWVVVMEEEDGNIAFIPENALLGFIKSPPITLARVKWTEGEGLEGGE